MFAVTAPEHARLISLVDRQVGADDLGDVRAVTAVGVAAPRYTDDVS